MQITVAKSWSELNEWQLNQIAHLYLNADPEDFQKSFEKMIFVLFQKENSFSAKRTLYNLIQKVTISQLAPFAEFLLKETNFYSFPEIYGLLKPADRLGNISIKQYSAIDVFFHAFEKDKSEINLNRLVASLYRIQEDYDELLLSEVGKITSAISTETKERIALAYKFTSFLIYTLYPVIYPKPKPETEEEKLRPNFKAKSQKHIPFEKVMIGLAMDELQPLGKKQDIDKTRIYEFMNVLTESILHQREKQKQFEKSQQ